MRMANGKNRTFAVYFAQWCETVYIQFEWEIFFYFPLGKIAFYGARSELDFADRKRGSKSYYYIMYKERNGQLLRACSCHIY